MECFDFLASFVFEVSTRGFLKYEFVDATIVVVDVDISGWSVKHSAWEI
jgi:hypothetical protein